MRRPARKLWALVAASGLVASAAASGSTAGAATATVRPSPVVFVPWHSYDVGAPGRSVAVGDFTGDGRQDVVVTSGIHVDKAKDHKLFLFGQTAAGGFRPPVQLDTHGNGVDEEMALAPADVDGDGRTDVVLATQKGIDVFLQRSGGLVFAGLVDVPIARQVTVADLDADGHLDLVVSTYVGVVTLSGDGTGGFAPAVPVTDMAYTEIDTGDVTGDGLPDVVGFRDAVVDVLARQPDGTFAAAVHYELVFGYWRVASGVAIGDLNGDGRNDVAVSIGGNSPGARINVFAQTTAGTLGQPSVYPAYEVADTLASADMNMDGRTDLLVVHRGWGRLGVFLQRPDGTLSTEQLSEIPSGQDYRPKALAAGDFNGDGVPDVALADANSGLVVLRSAGQVRTWGLGNLGQLGNGSKADTARASAPLDVTDIVGASAGAYHNLALARDGRVWSWGLNHVGQLGTGSTVDRSTPTLVPGITNATNVTAGPVHSLAIKDDGTVWAWGWNAYGQLGVGSTTDRPVPTRIPGLANVTALAGGAAHSLAVTADGSVWAWGLNHVGQLGTGDTTGSLVPVKVPGLTNVVAVTAGLFHSMALTAYGEVWAWGFNDEGEVGTGSEAVYEPVPHMVKSGASAIAAGAFHSIAVAWDGTVWTWGSNQVGQLGDGTTHQRRLPNRINIWYGIRTVSAGWYHTIAVANNGGTWAWGWNYFGQLGDGTTTTAREAVRVEGMSPSLVTAGVAHSLAITARGE